MSVRSCSVIVLAAGFALFGLAAAACSSDDVDAEDEANVGGTGTGSVAATSLVRGGTTANSGNTRSATGGIFPATGGSSLATGGSFAQPTRVPSTGGASTLTWGNTAGVNGSTGGKANLGSGGLGAAGTPTIDTNCISWKACTANCTAKCPTDSSKSYDCTCTNGKLECDVATCSLSTDSCDAGSSCTRDCSATCPNDSTLTYGCTCSGGRLDCDATACLATAGTCPTNTADGSACSSDLSICTLGSGSICVCFSGQWTCF